MAKGMFFRREHLNKVITGYGLFMVSAASVPNLGVGNYSTLGDIPKNLEDINEDS